MRTHIEVNDHEAFQNPRLIRANDIVTVYKRDYEYCPDSEPDPESGLIYEIVFELEDDDPIMEAYDRISVKGAISKRDAWWELLYLSHTCGGKEAERFDDYKAGNEIAKMMRDKRYERIRELLCGE
jgi:hypothetical protein